MVPVERAMVVSYSLSIVNIIFNHSAAISYRISKALKSTGVGPFESKFLYVPFRVDPWCWVLHKANPQAARLTNREIIIEELDSREKRQR